MRVAIIGAGLQGKRRTNAIKQHGKTEIVVIVSRTLERAKNLAKIVGCEATTDWVSAVNRKDVDAVIVCTPTGLHAQICISAMESGKHVLVEKPMASTLSDAIEMIKCAKKTNTILRVGFNHRFHPSIQEAYNRVKKGNIGKILFARSVYGICGRPGYEKEWRADPKLAGGGHLLEQGIHSIDLFRLFIGEFEAVTGTTATLYWKMPVEDNSMVIFKTKTGQIASLHSSLTQWKNLFLFEIFGEEGYLIIKGLGGSYGNEILRCGSRDFFKPFTDEVIEYRGEDKSWLLEWESFLEAIEGHDTMIGSPEDGYKSLYAVHLCYEAAKTSRWVLFSDDLDYKNIKP